MSLLPLHVYMYVCTIWLLQFNDYQKYLILYIKRDQVETVQRRILNYKFNYYFSMHCS
jgi:hypothetical protein